MRARIDMWFRNLLVVCNVEAVATCCRLSLCWLSCFCRQLGTSKTLQTSPNLGLPSIRSNLSQLVFFSYDGLRDGTPRLTGNLPASWGAMTNLVNFQAYSAPTLPDVCSLSGPLPDAWNGMLQLQSLGLRGCKITGTLPESWRNMPQLASVTVTYNQLTGTLPASWAALTNLSAVRLSNNRLSGSVPESWDGMSYLGYVALVNDTHTSNITATWSSTNCKF